MHTGLLRCLKRRYVQAGQEPHFGWWTFRVGARRDALLARPEGGSLRTEVGQQRRELE